MTYSSVLDFFLRRSPLTRRLSLIALDALLLPLSVWLSFWLRLATPCRLLSSRLVCGWLSGSSNWPSVVCHFWAIQGSYALRRQFGFIPLGGAQWVARTALAVVGVMFSLPMPPRSSWLLLWSLLTGFTGVMRFILRDFLITFKADQELQLTRVLIYGAGDAGAHLASALRLARSHQIVGFLDDDRRLWRRNLNGIPIFSPDSLYEFAPTIDQVLLAMPTLTRSQRRQLVVRIQSCGVSVLQVPSVDDITSGRARIDALRPIAIEDLLGRDSVPPNPELLGPGIRNCTVCVTGAGGSIGSELCRQILTLQPSKLILLERSEPSLYAIEQELKRQLTFNTDLVAVLGDAGDPELLKQLFNTFSINLIFHAAAYKHVPLVEANPLAGLKNNVLKTGILCREAQSAGVDGFVLISTDKAVRPTNVMGASKDLRRLLSSFCEPIAEDLFFNGAFWQRSWFFWFSCPLIPSSDQIGRANNSYSPRYNSIFYDNPRGCAVGPSVLGSS